MRNDSPKPIFYKLMLMKAFKRELSLAQNELEYECLSLSNVEFKVNHKSHEVDNHNASIGINRICISEQI